MLTDETGKIFRFESTVLVIFRTLRKSLLLSSGKDFFSSLRFWEKDSKLWVSFFSFFSYVSLITLLTFNVIWVCYCSYSTACVTTTSKITFNTDTNNAQFISFRDTLKLPIPLVWTKIGMCKGTLPFSVWQTHTNYAVINSTFNFQFAEGAVSPAEFSDTCLCMLR